jgi:hypothetical protein|tara:strand:- start:42 stop:2468 length:2427 start_codon:yes stop_codon:yes gene_type:complete
MINDFTKKEAPVLSTLGLGGGNASRLFLSGAVLQNRSLRFNPADSPTLSRTFASAGNRRTWTFSCWVKRTTSFNTYRHTLASGPGTTLSFSETAQGGPDEWFFYVDGTPYLLSNAKLRDTSAWYHAVFVFDTTNSTQADRCRVYQNGVRVTSWRNTAYPSQNFEGSFNTAGTIKVGCGNANEFLDGYMTDVYFIDGQALDPTSFGAADSNGVWQRSTYSGSYGTNGFHILDFANDETIGNDTSGNGNHFTASNFSTTAGSGNDVLSDFPTNDTVNTDSGAGGEVTGNYACINPLLKPDTQTVTLSNGNLDFSSGAASGQYGTRFSSIGVTSGKWYAEFTVGAVSNGLFFGVSRDPNGDSNYIGGHSTSFGYSANGSKYTNNSASGYGDSFTTNDVIGLALDLDNGTLTFYKNGSSQGTAYNSMGTGTFFMGVSGTGSATAVCNFGQREFSYAAPSNHKCLTTTSLPTPTIADGSAYFQTKLFTGTGSSNALTMSNSSMSPDWVWIKERSTSGNHELFDVVRGANKILEPDGNNAEATVANTLTSFDSNGFTLGTSSLVNDNNVTYAAWSWDAGSSTASNTDGDVTSQVRVNQTAGISIVSWTNPSSGSGAFTVGHSLGASPSLVIIKSRSNSGNWNTFHSSVSTDTSKYLNLNTTDAVQSYSGLWGSALPTNSVFGLGSNFRDGYTMIAYCISPVSGFSAVGSYTGNQSTDGTFVPLNFKPAFVMLKHTQTNGYDWAINDAARNTSNPASNGLFPSASSAEDSSRHVDFLSNGFKLRNSSPIYNQSGIVYAYLAFAENPFQANGGLAR